MTFLLMVTRLIWINTKTTAILRSSMIMGDKTLLRFHRVDKNREILSRGLLIRINKQLRKEKHLSSLTQEPALIVCSTTMEDQSTNHHLNSHRGLLLGTSNKSVRAQAKRCLTTQ